jgi:hypothetical protein
MESEKSKNEIFIEKAKLKHGDKYDYSLVNYINNSTKVKIICNVEGHGVFEQTPSLHTSGSGCRKCGTINFINKMSKTKEKFIELIRIRYDEDIYEKIKHILI